MVSEEMRRSATMRLSTLKILQNPLYLEIALRLYVTNPDRVPYSNLVKTLMDMHSSGHASYLNGCHIEGDYYYVAGGALYDLVDCGIVNDQSLTEEVNYSLTPEGYKIMRCLTE